MIPPRSPKNGSTPERKPPPPRPTFLGFTDADGLPHVIFPQHVAAIEPQRTGETYTVAFVTTGGVVLYGSFTKEQASLFVEGLLQLLKSALRGTGGCDLDMFSKMVVANAGSGLIVPPPGLVLAEPLQ